MKAAVDTDAAEDVGKVMAMVATTEAVDLEDMVKAAAMAVSAAQAHQR